MGNIKKYDVIIVGSGPAGIFTALEIVKKTSYSVLMLEKGSDIKKRKCPIEDKDEQCHKCKTCSILCGWGGAGAYSDGKLTLTHEVGGNLTDYVSDDKAKELIDYVDRIYLKYGAPAKIYGKPSPRLRKLMENALKHDLKLISTPLRHLGTDKTKEMLAKIENDLTKAGVKVRFNEPVKNILVEKGKACGVRTY